MLVISFEYIHTPKAGVSFEVLADPNEGGGKIEKWKILGTEDDKVWHIFG